MQNIIHYIALLYCGACATKIVCFSEAQLGHFSEFNQEKSKMTDNVFFFSCRYGAHFRQKAEVDKNMFLAAMAILDK